MNPTEFAQKIRTKYPGAYDNVPDDVLTKKIIEKYPVYASQIKVDPQKNSKPLMDKILDNPVTRGIQAVFPGKKVGEAIGTLGGYALSSNKDQYDLSAPSPLQVGADVAQGALTIATPGIGTGGSVAGRIATNAALGAGISGTGAIAEGKGVKDIAKETVIGGAAGGVISGTVEGASYLSKNLPRWFTKLSLPKLKNFSGSPDEVVDYALNNTKGLTLQSIYKNSNESLSHYESQVQNVLNHPEYINNLGDGTNSLLGAVESTPNAELTASKVANIAKKVAPSQEKLITKIEQGTANLKEKNEVRKALDYATKKVFTDAPDVSFNKEVAHNFADSLRSEVQGIAEETQPIFEKYAKEQTLNKAVVAALKKKRVAGPLVAGAGGFASGGLTGAIEAIAVEEGIRSPTAKLLAAKIIKNISPKLGAVANPVIQAGKAPLIKNLGSQNKDQ